MTSKLGKLEYFSDALGTIYADDIGSATAEVVARLIESGYSDITARTTARNLRFVGVAVHGDE